MKNNNNFKKTIGDVWDEHKHIIKVGAKCMAFGLFVGFCKGVLTCEKMHSNEICMLIKKIPYTPDCEDICEYVHEHIDELKPYIIAELEFNE